VGERSWAAGGDRRRHSGYDDGLADDGLGVGEDYGEADARSYPRHRAPSDRSATRSVSEQSLAMSDPSVASNASAEYLRYAQAARPQIDGADRRLLPKSARAPSFLAGRAPE